MDNSPRKAITEDSKQIPNISPENLTQMTENPPNVLILPTEMNTSLNEINNSIKKEELSEKTIIDDLEELPYTASEDMIRIKGKDTSVEIIGYVEQIDGLKFTRNNKYIINFSLTNDEDRSIKVVAWNKEAHRIKKHIQLLAIIHINGASASKTDEAFNLGNVPVQLPINSNTEVEVLGEHILKPKNIDVFTLSNITTFPTRIVYYVKTKFGIVEHHADSSNNSCTGSIACNRKKLNVKITKFADNYKCPFDKGDHVKLLGRFKPNSKFINLQKE